ncbi:unnamed protein product [Polarella glacialis]|nr:unnamed protein product [Polarella glacialis]
MSVGQPAEEIFLHKKAMDGGADGPHTQAVGEGSQVTYELMASPVDGKPCACKVQVMGVKSSLPPDNESRAQKEVLIRKLLENGMQVGIHQDKGVGKASMEDRMICRPGITVDALGATCKKVVCSLFGVFDGHSGASCSEFVSNHLDRYLFDSFRHQKRDGVAGDMAMRSALQAAFRTTEHNFFQYANKLDAGPAMAWSTAGSTACTCTLFGPDEEGRLRLATANAGDSRAVLGRKDGRAIRLSEDHTPEVPTERKRIEQAGSSIVNCSGIWRIVLPSRKGTGVAGLSVSRGFGDLEYKQGAAVVSAVPDVFLRTIDLRVDTFVIIASDGVWGPISDTEAVRIVSVALREGGEDPAKAAAQSLLEKAHLLDGHDDKTVIVIWFGDVPDEPPKVTVAPGPVTYMRPVSVKPVANDMFEEKRPKPDLGQQMSELDNLFASYARDIG